MSAPTITAPATASGGIPVGGSGADGYVAKWTAATTLGGSTTTGATASLYVDATGNVGIGTASPSYKLTIENSDSTAYSTTTQASPMASLRNTYGSAGNTQAILVHSTANYSSVWNTGLVETGGGAYTGAYIWQNRTGASTWAERMRIDSTGALTVRTVANPNSYTIVAQDNIAIYTGTDATGTTSLRLGSSTSLPQGCAVVKGTKTAAGGSGTMTFQTTLGGTLGDRMTIDATGNVGIGTASPTGRLHVVGGTAAAATNGAPVTIIAQNAGTGNQNGGNIVLTPGALSGTGSAGVADLSGPTGTGLKLPATPGNADAQTLDCYQETTWTPTLSAPAATWGGTAPTVNFANYTRVGRLIFFEIELAPTAATAFSTTWGISSFTLPVSAPRSTAVACNRNAASANAVTSGANLLLPTFGLSAENLRISGVYAI